MRSRANRLSPLFVEMSRSNSRSKSKSNSNSNLPLRVQSGGIFGKRGAITDAQANQLYDTREKTQAVTAYREPTAVKPGVLLTGRPQKVHTVREAIKLRSTARSLPSHIFVIHERVELPKLKKLESTEVEEVEEHPELLDDSVDFQRDYFPLTHGDDLIKAAHLFHTVFGSNKLSLTDPNFDVKSTTELGILKSGLKNRFTQLRTQINRLRYSLGDTIKVRGMLEQALKLKKFIEVLDDLGVHDPATGATPFTRGPTAPHPRAHPVAHPLAHPVAHTLSSRPNSAKARAEAKAKKDLEEKANTADKDAKLATTRANEAQLKAQADQANAEIKVAAAVAKAEAAKAKAAAKQAKAEAAKEAKRIRDEAHKARGIQAKEQKRKEKEEREALAVTRAAQAVQTAAEHPCPPQEGGQLSVIAETPKITEDQLKRIVRNFAFLVLQSMKSNPKYTDLQTINPVELVQKLNNDALTENVMKDYLAETGTIPPLISSIIDDSNSNKDTLLKTRLDAEKRNLLDMLVKSLMNSLADNSKSELNLFVEINTSKPLDEQLIKLIKWIGDKITSIEKGKDETANTIRELESHVVQLEGGLKKLEEEKHSLTQNLDIVTASEAQMRSAIASISDKLIKKPADTQGEVVQHKNIIEQLQTRIQEIETELATTHAELNTVKSTIAKKQDGTFVTQQEYTNLLTSLQSLEANLKTPTVTQSGGQQEVNALIQQRDSLKKALDVVSVGTDTSHYQKEIDDLTQQIHALETKLQTLEAQKSEVEVNRGKLYDKAEGLAKRLTDGTSEDDIFIFLKTPTDSQLKHTDADPLLTLYSRFKEREKSIVAKAVEDAKHAEIKELPHTNELCYLSFFISFFIKELFFTKGTADDEKNQQIVHDTVVASCDKIYSEALLNDLFKALQQADANGFTNPFVLQRSEYPILVDKIIQFNTNVTAILDNLYSNKFNGFYSTVKGLQYTNESSSFIVSYTTLFTYFICLGKKFLVSLPAQTMKCPLNKFLAPPKMTSVSDIIG